MLADYGADVLKVERPGTGDPARAYGPFPGDIPHPDKSGLFLHLNTNKKSITLDFSTDTGRAILYDLVLGADVVVENFSPSVKERLGFTYDDLAAVNPGIVLCSISNFGQTGPYRDWKAVDMTMYAFSGQMNGSGQLDSAPLKTADLLMQGQAGSGASAAIVAAAMHQRRTGTGQAIDLAIAEISVGSADRRMTALIGYQYTGDMAIRDVMLPAALPIGFYPCADGYVCMTVAPPARWTRYVDLLGKPELKDDPRFQDPMVFSRPEIKDELDLYLFTWLAENGKQEAMEQAQQHRIAGTAINSTVDSLNDPHLKARGYFVEAEHPKAGRLPYPGASLFLDGGRLRVEDHRAPARRAQRGDLLGAAGHDQARNRAAPLGGGRMSTALPLSHIRVLDLTLIWAGPYAVTQLGDLGAEIIRVESLQHHITNTRGFVPWPKTKEEVVSLGYLGGLYAGHDAGTRPWNKHGMFNGLGRNKKSMTVDMTRPEGVEIVHDLVKVCDVLVENNTVGLLERFGLDWETVHRINPAMVYVTMPIHGLSGPYGDYMGFGPNGEAISGLLSLRGYDDSDITTSGNSNHMDTTSGMAAAYAALMALYERDETGVGRFVEVSQVEHLMTMIGAPLMDAAMNGRAQTTLGNRDPVRAPQNAYPCAGEDRWVALSVGSDQEWDGLCHAIGRADLIEDARFEDAASRQANRDALDEIISAWTSQRDSRAAMNDLQAHGVPASMVANERDLYDDPHLRDRGFFHEKTQEDCGTHRYPGHTFKLSKTPLRFDTAPPLLGEHNPYVYRELLGVSPSDYRRLEEEKHIGMDYVPEVR